MSVRLVESTPEHFAALLAGKAPYGVQRLAESELAPPPVLKMLADLAARIEAVHGPSAWMIVEDGCVAGLLSLVAEPADRTATIGYGIAECHRGRGLASEAIRQLLTELRDDGRIDTVLAETSTANPSSQHVLQANGFAETGTRLDPDDGELICWRSDLA